MKKLFITLFAFFLTISSTYAQRTFACKIDDKYYTIDEQSLNTLFNTVFNSLVDRRTTKDKYFYMWASTYDTWKWYTSRGTLIFELYGNRIAKSSFQGDIPLAYLGRDPDGTDARGNPNKIQNVARRVSLMNYLLNREIIQFCIKQTIIQ